MKILVCGSRHFIDYEKMKEVLDEIHRLHGITHIIQGEARGADTLGRMYGEAHGITVTGYPALWEEYGRRAGPIRNARMLREGAPNMVVAFLGPESRGTKNMIEQATKANVPVKVINI